MTAASKPLASKEEKNFLRLSLLLFKLSFSAVKFIFDQEFCPETLQKEISKKKNWDILFNLKKKKTISGPQWDSLFPPKGLELQSSNLDITLMICLLRNLAAIDVYDRQPRVDYNIDFSVGTAISTIKFYRNKLAHIDNCSVSDLTFNEMFDDVAKAIVKLNPALGIECDPIRHGTFDKNLGILTAMHEMCRVGNYELVHSLIQKELPVNEENEFGFTPLHIASHEGYTNIVELLLSHGATAVVNKGQITGSRPLHFASHEGHKEIVKLLLHHGADIHQGNIKESRPIHLAAHENQIDVVNILIENGANVNDINKNGSTALHLASYKNLTDMAELLIKNGADINKAKLDKRTPLHVACIYGNSEIVSLLCKYKALVNQPDKFGRTPLSYAKENRNEQIISILQKIDHS
ncbi:26S proteasome non-ATPase regulatory subunit 10-like isoform X2 [Mytilus californianus]|uniref:26S proteasome non-ATPase regulatory subunit 10-like isoform X2 n=1 Tax=Mytilus californianus TaxID=6549 RepID=UPI0022470DAB|nr:26S proteasome non-ATPase regulatory subunit 10-like isoform X2 [Mytilus californianus]